MDKIDIKTKLKIFFFRRKYIKEIEEKIKASEKDIYTYFKPHDINPEANNYRELMIENHRRLWGWIAYWTLKKKNKIYKGDYFKFYDVEKKPINQCYCCEYAQKIKTIIQQTKCECCPMRWSGSSIFFTNCTEPHSNYCLWMNSLNWEISYYHADKIANLKERKKENK